jgi:protein-tyrosine kinase
MSRIYKALEKAEKEREKELKRIVPLISTMDETRIAEERVGKERMEEKEETLIPATPGLPQLGALISDKRLVSYFHPGSLATEQFRKLRTYLFREKESGPPKTIMITSATSNEGKSLITSNLAIGIAHDLQAHALIVDCDLRNPTIGRLFGLQNRKGLADYLSGTEGIPELMRKTEIEKLTVIPGGTIQENPAELIGSKKMEALVEELKSRYSDRYIIFDSTPLLATSESEVLGKLVDGIIVVVRAGVTPRETVKQAIASLEQEKILGFVLNSLEFKSPGLSSRYFGSHGYYYKYGYRQEDTNHHGWWKKLFRSGQKTN